MAEETILVKVVLEAGEYKAEIEKISQVSGTAEKAVSGLEESTKGLGAQLQKGVGLSEFKKGADEVTASLSRQKGVVEQIENDIKQLNKQLSNTAPGKAQQTLQKEVNAANRVLREEIAILKGIQSETEKTGAKKVSLTSKVRQLRNELVALELAGKRDTEQFRQLSREAGILQDAITDVSQQTKNLASDTANLDAFAQGITGLAGGFAAAQGAAALFGKENEDVQKALLKVQATLAIVNGLQAVFNTLQKQSAFSLKANAAATTIATGAMSKLGFSVNTTSTAFKALRTAIIATGIGAIVALIAVLSEQFSKTSDNIKDADEKAEKFKKTIQDISDAGVKLKEDLEDALLSLSVAQNKLNEDEAESIRTGIKLQKQIKERLEQGNELINNEERLLNLKADGEKADAKSLEQLRQLIEGEKELLALFGNIGASEERRKLLDQELAAIKDLEQQQADLTAARDARELARKLKIQELARKKNKEDNDKRLADQKKFLDDFEKLTLDSFNNTLDEEGRLNQENFVKRRALIDAFEKLTNKEKLEKKEELDAALLLLEEELQKKINKIRLDAEEETNKKISALRSQITSDTILNIDTEASKRRREGRETLKQELDDSNKKFQADIKNFKGNSAQRKARVEKFEQEQSDIRKKYADIDAAYAEEVFNSSLQLTNALFSLQASLRQKALDDIQKQRELELRNFQGTEEEKARIEEKFAAKEKQARIKAVQQERDRAIFEATIQAALNILKAGVDPLLIALAVTTAAVQIAAIKSAPLPRFEKGGKVEGKSHRLGGTIIEAERDEFVVNKKAVRKYEPFIESINKADGSFERMVFDKFVFPKIADLTPSQATILKATFKSDKIEKELRMSRKADQKNTRLLAGIMQSERHHSQSERYRW